MCLHVFGGEQNCPEHPGTSPNRHAPGQIPRGSRGSQHVMEQLSNLAITSVSCHFLLAFNYLEVTPQENTEQ